MCAWPACCQNAESLPQLGASSLRGRDAPPPRARWQSSSAALFLPVSGPGAGCQSPRAFPALACLQKLASALATAQRPVLAGTFLLLGRKEVSGSHVPGLARPEADAPVRGREGEMRGFWGPDWLRNVWGEGTENEPPPRESWPVFEVLGSSRRVNRSAPGSYLGLGPCGEVTWPDPRRPAWEGGPRTCGPGLPSASPGLSCQCQGASSTSLAKLPRAICQHGGEIGRAHV